MAGKITGQTRANRDIEIHGVPGAGTAPARRRKSHISLLSVLGCSLIVACGGEFSSSDESENDETTDSDGGDGDVVTCDLSWVYGLTVTVIGGAEPSGAEPGEEAPGVPAPYPGTGGSGADIILPPDTGGTSGVGGFSGVGGSTGVGGEIERDVCTGAVVATEGDYTETLMCSVSGADCECYGLGERAGTYTVTVTLADRVGTVPDFVIAEDECHVIPRHIDFFE